MKKTNASLSKIIRQQIIQPGLVLLLAAGLFTSCKDDDEDTPPLNEQELITTVNLKLTEVNTTNVINASFKDLDGPGGAAPIVADLLLKPNTVYNGEISILDESKNPPLNITEEIEEEDEDHQFFYTPSTVNLTIAYDDADDNNLPVGLKTKITTGGDSSGKLRITLKHQPGIKNNNIATGETDIEIEFNTLVE